MIIYLSYRCNLAEILQDGATIGFFFQKMLSTCLFQITLLSIYCIFAFEVKFRADFVYNFLYPKLTGLRFSSFSVQVTVYNMNHSLLFGDVPLLIEPKNIVEKGLIDTV